MDDFDEHDYVENAGTGSRIRPEAKDLLGGMGAQILRSMLVAAPDEIYSEYGFSPEDASVSLACCELAELPCWDETALVDAATVGGNDEQRALWGSENREKVSRRISLALNGGALSPYMSPAAGVLLLRRLGIHVFHELLDAVAIVTLSPFTEENQDLYRELTGFAKPEGGGLRPDRSANGSAPPTPPPDETGLLLREKQIRAIIEAAEAKDYEVMNIPKGGKKLLMAICKERWPTLFGAGDDPFLGAWKEALAAKPQRLRTANHDQYVGK